MPPLAGRAGAAITDLRQEIAGNSALFGFVLRLFLGFAQGHGLLECLAHFIQALVIEVMHALGALGIEVYQFVVLAHDRRKVAVRLE
jgi:uncharacterized protein (UPF0264 family)